MTATDNHSEPFPDIDPNAQPPKGPTTLGQRIRGASTEFGQSNPPEGFSAATGDIASTVFSRQLATQPTATTFTDQNSISERSQPRKHDSIHGESTASTIGGTAPYPNGYHFPPKHSFGQSTKEGLVASWKYVTTPLGFCVTVYGLNIVAWGGMLFLLLCNASPAMCYPSCNDINSPRRKWIEWDSQILNALFCVTGFGLAPWRFRDLYYLLQYRIKGDYTGLRRLAGIHRGWFRLPGSDTLPLDVGTQTIADRNDGSIDDKVPFPVSKIPDAPLTGVRALPTQLWKLDAIIWLMVWNTFFQVCLAVFMWHMDRFERPSWTTGLFVGLACVVAGVGGYMMFLEGKAVKSVEGVPVSEVDLQRLERDREQGVYHYNNIKDKDLEAEKEKKNKQKG